ncbi:MAG: L-seryl-tRNA(Sec) selenium transferase, partial [Kofleriaceae bacterium]
IAIARSHPLLRTLRPDKLTLAALAATLALHRDGNHAELPTAVMLAARSDGLRARADQLAGAIGAVDGITIAVESCTSTVGGGAMPTAELASWAVTLRGSSPDTIERRLRGAATPVIARIDDGRVWLDVRTIAVDELDAVIAAVRAVV